jgi:hypothetical protein
MYLFVYLSFYLSFNLFIFLSIFLSIYLSIYVFNIISIYLFNYASNTIEKEKSNFNSRRRRRTTDISNNSKEASHFDDEDIYKGGDGGNVIYTREVKNEQEGIDLCIYYLYSSIDLSIYVSIISIYLCIYLLDEGDEWDSLEKELLSQKQIINNLENKNLSLLEDNNKKELNIVQLDGSLFKSGEFYY